MAKLIWTVLLLGGCTIPDVERPVGGPQVEYSAVGQEPGWTLRIDRDRINYAGDYGDTRISVARPPAQTTASGRRYATSRLTVDIAPGLCRDAMSGSGFADTVTVTTASRTVRGCGGERLIEERD